VRPGAGALADLDRTLTGLRLLPGGPRWADPSTWHITLAFLGEVADPRVDPVAAEVGRAVAAAGPAAGRPFRLRLAGAGTFPARGAPRVLWAGVTGAGAEVDAAAERLGRLARAVRRAARAAGVPVERRPYRPHLTLGRWRPADAADRAVADPLTGYAGPPFDVAEILLIRSHLGPQPRYEHLLAWPLGPGG
jgi:2'-5' RNA ligase